MSRAADDVVVCEGLRDVFGSNIDASAPGIAEQGKHHPPACHPPGLLPDLRRHGSGDQPAVGENRNLGGTRAYHLGMTISGGQSRPAEEGRAPAVPRNPDLSGGRMDRRNFLRLTGLGVGTLMVPVLGRPGNLFGATTPIPTGDRKALADAALNAAKSRGATYADVRIGRYLNQFVFTREDKVQNLVNTESYGVGVRVIADGTWGFAATSDVTQDGIARAAEQAVATAKANAKIQEEPVRLAPTKAWGEVSWRTPIEKSAFDVPIKEKVDLLMSVNAAAMGSGAQFCNSALFLVNEQKYFASTDGTWADQDVHRLWPTFTATAVDETSGKFQNRDAVGPDGDGLGVPRHGRRR
jgi:hypothetical protein